MNAADNTALKWLTEAEPALDGTNVVVEAARTTAANADVSASVLDAITEAASAVKTLEGDTNLLTWGAEGGLFEQVAHQSARIVQSGVAHNTLQGMTVVGSHFLHSIVELWNNLPALPF